eukprot:CAMPEP_0113571886 /NCGR_PEP_ID=MMETSP0015_2-20120614/25800_1 /TAXON_ID=2838 /ORGANISM="Odontella" /LENGTH=482 /DNA_ID=CAMNT_0000474881 /DNA_START=131 /DNA_END=1576 /DNA_ORIENTATION=- /assembly_acc=CAM_ASM_000160
MDLDAVMDNPVYIAAIAVGAVILWSLLRSGSNDSKNDSSASSKTDRGLPSSGGATATPSQSGEDSAAATTGKKKKKKSKAKKKATAASAPAPAPAPAVEGVPEMAEETEAAAASGGGGGGGGGGKKKKKKKKGAGSVPASTKKASAPKPAAKADTTPEDSDSDDERAETIRPPSAPVKPSAQLPKTQGLTKAEKKQQLADLNDGWEIAADPKKKKKRGGGAKKAASAQTGGANAAAGSSSGFAEISVQIDVKKVGIIIGPKGATMQSIQDATNTKLDINASKEADPRKPASVKITGKKADAERAKKAIQELCAKGYTTLTQEAGFMENSVSVHPQVLSEIVGPGGKNIRAIQEKLGVKVTIPPTDWKPNQAQLGKVKPVRVGVAGTKEACKKAKDAILAISHYHHHEVTHPGLTHEEVDVSPEFLHCVIGARGSELRHIKGNYSCEVYIPNADSYSEYVVVVGRAAQVERAIAHINNLMDRE